MLSSSKMDILITHRLVNSARSTVELGLRASRFGAITVRHEPMVPRLWALPKYTPFEYRSQHFAVHLLLLLPGE